MTDRATYQENTHPIAVQAVVHWLPKDRRSRLSTVCRFPGRPTNRNCPIVLCPAAMASDMPIMCLPLTEGESSRVFFCFFCSEFPVLHLFARPCTVCAVNKVWLLYLSSLSGCPLNAQNIKRKHTEEEMMTIKLRASSGETLQAQSDTLYFLTYSQLNS